MSKTKTAEARRSSTSEDAHELNSNIVKALSHPLRMRILTRLNAGVASPNEMAKEFDESLPLNVEGMLRWRAAATSRWRPTRRVSRSPRSATAFRRRSRCRR